MSTNYALKKYKYQLNQYHIEKEVINTVDQSLQSVILYLKGYHLARLAAL